MHSILFNMEFNIENWKSQIRKGYLELCILLLIKEKKKLYGFELLEVLEKQNFQIKEGTLYPLLSRMGVDDLLTSVWDTSGTASGHPRKFYFITKKGEKALKEMSEEFNKLKKVYDALSK